CEKPQELAFEDRRRFRRSRIAVDPDVLELGLRVALVDEELLMDLLSRAQSRELDLHVTVRLFPHEEDEVARHVGDIHRLAHIENEDRKSIRLNSSHVKTSYAVFCLKKKNNKDKHIQRTW